MPRPVIYREQRLPATYMNFYFVNGALLVPTFGQKRGTSVRWRFCSASCLGAPSWGWTAVRSSGASARFTA